jgi:hypothetical protein
MKQFLLIFAMVALVGCEKSLEDKVVGKYSAMVGPVKEHHFEPLQEAQPHSG